MNITLPQLVLLTACAWVAGIGTAAGDAPADPYAELRREFVAAHAAAEAGRPAPPSGDSEALQAYVLYPYIQAARLRAALRSGPPGSTATATDAAARAFLERHGAAPYTRPLRYALLVRLAQGRRWGDFLAVYATASNPDQLLRCRAIEARIALGQRDGLAEAVTAEWLTAKSVPDACDAGFDWLRAQGRLDDALVEQRARLALAAGEARLARWLARSLPEARARSIRDWATLVEQPAAGVDAAIATPAAVIEDAALLDGFSRLARRDLAAALERFEPLVRARGFDATRASPFARVLAVRLALSRRPDTLAYFARVLPVDFDDQAHEWHVRAALWTGDWPRVEAAIAAMPESLRGETRWRYWAARAAEARGERTRAQDYYRAVVSTDNWYAVHAAARLGQRFAPSQQAIPLDRAQVAALDAQPPFARSRELLFAEMRSLAVSEWRQAVDALPAADQLQAIGLAASWGWHFQAIATAAQQRVFNDYRLLYPRPFDAEVGPAARAVRLPETLIYAVLRQESLYQPYAISTADARGLMQLLPSTARATAAKLGRPRPSPADLLRPAVNVPLGAGYLRELVDRFDGQVVLALAGYNAGPGSVRRWLPDRPLDVDVWVENIPFNETRAYAQRVMWHSVVFQWLVDQAPEDATPWLVQVKP